MKKFFQILGLVSLISFSFIFTEGTINVAREIDELMITIKDKSKDYTIPANEASIKDNTIIPGISGKKVDLKKSYYNMKKVGKFVNSLLIYEDIKPKETLINNMDKYVISGNKKKNMISLIFLVRDNDDITDIIKILDKNDVKANFFVNYTWASNNNKIIENLIKDNHNIGNLAFNLDYSDSSFISVDTMIKKILNQKFSYCYSEVDNELNLKLCMIQKNYTIRPSIVIKDNPYINIKENIKSGSIISFEIKDNVKKELPSIIHYIKSKGYIIETLSTHLEE